MYRIFRHYIPKSLLLLGLAEFLILLVSVYLSVVLDVIDNQSIQGSSNASYLPLSAQAIVYTIILLGTMTAMGLYQRDLREGPKEILLRVGLSFVLALILMLMVYTAKPELFMAQSVFAVAFAASFFGVISCRFLCYQRTDSRFSRRILVIGAGERAQGIDRMRRRSDRWGLKIVGFVDVVGSGPCLIEQKSLLKVKSSLQELVRKQGVDEIVVALDDRRSHFPVDEILDCKMSGIDIIEAGEYIERQQGKICLENLSPSAVVFSDGFSNAMFKSVSKRAWDIVTSLGMLILTAPIMLFAAIAILAESNWRGSIIYRQQRVGLSGKPFNVLKFRSMREDAEKDGAVWAMKNDNRVTRIGGFMRKTRIDELPQIINVLKGDMSFVGPRPERPEFVTDLNEQIPFYSLRHHVKPGITGWAQICYPYGSTVEDTKEKLQFDLYYLKNYSFFLDITIILQTMTVILWGKGAR